MPTDPITLGAVFTAVVSSEWFQELARELARGAVNGFAKGFMESKAKDLSKPQKSLSGSSSIVQQSKEQAEWIQAQSEYLKRREEREKRAMEFKEEELQLQRQDLQERHELARLQRELMQKLHAEAIEVQLTETQTMWDLQKGFSKLSRKDAKDILCEEQQEYRLLVLVSPPKISKSCPDSFHNELEGDIRNDLKEFLHQYYPLNPEMGNFSPCPVKFNGDYLEVPIFDTEVELLHKVFALVPTVVLYSEVREYKVNFHIGYWGLYDDKVSLLPMPAWNWKQAWQELKEAGVDNDESLLIIRQIIVMVHKLLAAFVADLYYLYIDGTATYEPRLFEFEEEFAREWFPQELVRDFIEILRELQQQRRELYEAELEKLAKFPPWRLTCTFSGFDDDSYKLVGISAEGKSLFGETSDRRAEKAWNLRSGKLMTAVEIWQSGNVRLLHTLKGHSNDIYSIAFSLDGELLATGSSDRTVKLWYHRTGELVHTQEGDSYIDQSIAFSADEQFLASYVWDKTITLWHPHTKELLRTLEGHSDYVLFVTFSFDSQLLASSSCDDTIKLWNPHTGALLHTLEGHSGNVNYLAFSPDGELLASGGFDGTIKLWYTHSGELLDTLEGHSKYVSSLAFSPDGQLLASGSSDNTIKVWRPQAGNSVPANCEFPVTSPDRSLLVKANYDWRTETWNLEIIDAATDKLLETLPGHSGSIEQVIFSEDGNTMVSLGGDLVIKVWRRGDG